MSKIRCEFTAVVIAFLLSTAAQAIPTSDGAILLDDFTGNSLNGAAWDATHNFAQFGLTDGTVTVAGGTAQIQSTETNFFTLLDTKLGLPIGRHHPINGWLRFDFESTEH